MTFMLPMTREQFIEESKKIALRVVKATVRPDPVGTVTNASPLTVLIDGDVEPVQVDLKEDGLTLTTNDRVLLHWARGRLVASHKVVAS